MQLTPGADADAAARELERAFLANDLEAKSTRELLHDAIGPLVHAELAAARASWGWA